MTAAPMRLPATGRADGPGRKCKAVPAWSFLAVSLWALAAVAEDPRERQYFTPALPPRHADKPKVAGWAQQRVEERLGRGLIAVETGQGSVYLGWRLLKSDPAQVAFNVYRSAGPGGWVRLNKAPVTAVTDFVDSRPVKGQQAAYRVCPVVGGKELPSCSEAVLAGRDARGQPYRSVRFAGDYVPHKVAVADLDGDGAYDFVIKQPGKSIDPAGRADTEGTTYKLEGYLSTGRFLWRKDLGPGIEPGIWYSPFVVYDFDGDGRAEVAVKTGPEDVRRADGRVRTGAEWCSILDGLTGRELARADWPPRDRRYGDYNRTNRNQMGLAYLDGKTPCLLVARGTYKLMVVDAYQYHHGRLERLWHWDGDEETPVIRSQGAHGMHSADVDGDGRDEVVLGSAVLDDNGTCLYSVGLGHPDKCFVTDVDPTRPGLEIFYAIEPWHDDGMGVCLVDAATGKTLWGLGRRTYHVGDGMVADIDASIPGLECFAAEDPKGGSRQRYMLSARGKPLGGRDVPGCRNWVFWDADLLRETFAGIRTGRRRSLSVVKYKGPTLTTGIEGGIAMIADILGDWREEVVTVLPGQLRVYTTTIEARDRRVSLMQDPVYRAEVAHRSMGYEQSPVPGYYLGVGPDDAPADRSTVEERPG